MMDTPSADLLEEEYTSYRIGRKAMDLSYHDFDKWYETTYLLPNREQHAPRQSKLLVHTIIAPLGALVSLGLLLSGIFTSFLDYGTIPPFLWVIAYAGLGGSIVGFAIESLLSCLDDEDFIFEKVSAGIVFVIALIFLTVQHTVYANELQANRGIENLTAFEETSCELRSVSSTSSSSMVEFWNNDILEKVRVEGQETIRRDSEGNESVFVELFVLDEDDDSVVSLNDYLLQRC